jgi:hypothetical protein
MLFPVTTTQTSLLGSGVAYGQWESDSRFDSRETWLKLQGNEFQISFKALLRAFVQDQGNHGDGIQWG